MVVVAVMTGILTLPASSTVASEVDAEFVRANIMLPAVVSAPQTLRRAKGDVVPMLTLPLFNMVKTDVEALLVKFANTLAPVPEPHTDSGADGVDVPIPRKLLVLSQKNFELAAKVPEPPLNWT